MSIERPNADIIRAYAHGKTVEYRVRGDVFDWNTYGAQGVSYPCLGSSTYEWRIKPEVLQYRVALMKSVHSAGSTFWFTLESRWEDNLEDNPKFVRWVTNIEEVEVE
jgi:hypothetical protein